jgi:hypothetical protein
MPKPDHQQMDVGPFTICTHNYDGEVMTIIKHGAEPGTGKQVFVLEQNFIEMLDALMTHGPHVMPLTPRVGEDEVIEKLHALIDLLAHRFKGYLPWPSDEEPMDEPRREDYALDSLYFDDLRRYIDSLRSRLVEHCACIHKNGVIQSECLLHAELRGRAEQAESALAAAKAGAAPRVE